MKKTIFIFLLITLILPFVNSCVDSDGGLNYYEWGSLDLNCTGPCGAWSDRCINSTTLLEQDCDSPNYFVYYDCPNGCQDGACIKVDSECQNLYWIDNDNKECSKKEFCGAYMYLGLQTFENKEECQNAVNAACTCPEDAKVCPDGSMVGRVCPNCEFEPCKTNCPENSVEESGKCIFKLSNGRKAEIKIMPETASEIAIAKLGDLGFTIELKEVGKGNEARVVYELTGNKKGRFLGIFNIMAKILVQVDAENGNIKVIKPWWSFLASGV